MTQSCHYWHFQFYISRCSCLVPLCPVCPSLISMFCYFFCPLSLVPVFVSSLCSVSMALYCFSPVPVFLLHVHHFYFFVSLMWFPVCHGSALVSSSLYLSLFLCVVTSSFILIVSCPVCLVFCFASSFPLVCISSSCVPTCYLSSHYPVWI